MERTMSESKHLGRFVLIMFAILPAILTAIFLVLKWIGVVDWPWIWVLSPIWIAFFGLIPIALLIKMVMRFIIKTGSKFP
jgi:hypothetical protein